MKKLIVISIALFGFGSVSFAQVKAKAAQQKLHTEQIIRMKKAIQMQKHANTVNPATPVAIPEVDLTRKQK